MRTHSWICPHETLAVGEWLSVTDIIADFKKSLALKEGGYYPTFNEVQTALQIMLSHMRVAGPSYIDFIESALKKHTEIIRESNGDNHFLGLNGYIRYLQDIIILPLELNIQWTNLKTTLRKVIEKNISMAESILQEMEDARTDTETLLRESELSADERARLIQARADSEKLINEAKSNLQNCERQRRDILAGENNTIQ